LLFVECQIIKAKTYHLAQENKAKGTYASGVIPNWNSQKPSNFSNISNLRAKPAVFFLLQIYSVIEVMNKRYMELTSIVLPLPKNGNKHKVNIKSIFRAKQHHVG
jgi:hypothetical protein